MKKILENLNYKTPRLIFSTTETNLINRCLLFYPSLSILYTYIPKNGCSTLKYTLGVNSGVIQEKQNPHQTEHLFRYANKMNFFPKDCENIICFRHPFERILSAYLDKFARVSPEPEALPVIEKVNQLTKAPTLGNSISFIEFIRFLNTTPNRELDAHWRPQIDFIFFEDYTKIFLLESLYKEWPEHFKDIPLLDFKVHSTSIKYDTDKKNYHINGEQLAIDAVNKGFPCINSFISDEIMAIFEKRFSDDIKIYKLISGKDIFS